MFWMAVALCFLAGSLGSLQGTLNGQAGKALSLPAMIFAVSIVQAAFVLPSLLPQWSKGMQPFLHPRIWAAGLLGVIIMYGVAWSIPRIGTVATFVLVIFGQLFFSACIDTYGLLGAAAQPLSVGRLISLGLIMAGIATLLFTK
jgi:bacterial/archaeal transporter family-2 protein